MTTRLLSYAVGLVILWLLAMRIRSTKARQWLYLLASYAFYASWGPWFLIVLLFSSLMNYGLGEWLKKRTSSGRLWTGILLNVALLSTFKYLPLMGTVAGAGSPLAFLKHIVLPMGVSFWTFQALSYLFDLYREEELDPSLLEFCLYMAFWPTVLSGPICRMPSMLPQFRQPWSVSEEDLSVGFRRICIGVLMSVLAGVMGAGLRAGQGIDTGFDQFSGRLSGPDVWCLIFGYGFQLYFDFCGYSHVVIGAARLFGIQLHENFDRPYLSTTPSIFWTRWHMSLSFWIRDYVFLPLATLRREVWWRNLSLVIAMFVFGIWHKGSLLFMIWGTYHGLLLVTHRQWQEFRKRLGFAWEGVIATGISWLLTFSAVCVGYIFFRSDNMTQAISMLRVIFNPASYRHFYLPQGFYLMTSLAMGGYFAVVAVSSFLDRVQSRAVAAGQHDFLSLLACNRWVWVAPLIIVLGLYLNVIFQPGHAATGPVMYALF
jgi:alginate O-acetyltransferase complex protein AlgI